MTGAAVRLDEARGTYVDALRSYRSDFTELTQAAKADHNYQKSKMVTRIDALARKLTDCTSNSVATQLDEQTKNLSKIDHQKLVRATPTLFVSPSQTEQAFNVATNEVEAAAAAARGRTRAAIALGQSLRSASNSVNLALYDIAGVVSGGSDATAARYSFATAAVSKEFHGSVVNLRAHVIKLGLAAKPLHNVEISHADSASVYHALLKYAVACSQLEISSRANTPAVPVVASTARSHSGTQPGSAYSPAPNPVAAPGYPSDLVVHFVTNSLFQPGCTSSGHLVESGIAYGTPGQTVTVDVSDVGVTTFQNYFGARFLTSVLVLQDIRSEWFVYVCAGSGGY